VYYFIRGGFNGLTSHFWTLSFEEQFYLLWAVPILSVPRKRFFAASLLTISIGPLSSLLTQAFGIPVFAVMTPSCFDTLGLGSLLAISGYGKGLSPFVGGPHPGLRIRWPAALCIHRRCAGNVDRSHGQLAGNAMGVLHRLSAGLASVWLVSSAATGFRGLPQRIHEFPVIAYFGRISYGIYILHNLVPAFVFIAIQRSGANVSVWVGGQSSCGRLLPWASLPCHGIFSKAPCKD
jgi:peptidoglycan/LPS O-acetylase OafA/YrhL